MRGRGKPENMTPPKRGPKGALEPARLREALAELWEALGELWEGLGGLWDSPDGLNRIKIWVTNSRTSTQEHPMFMRVVQIYV